VEANFPVALEYAGRILEQVGEFDRAVEHFCRALRAGGAATLNLAGLVRAHALADRRDEAANAMDQLVEISRQRYVPAYHLAIAYLALEQQEETFAALDSCVQNRCGWNIYLNVEPRLDAARSDPRFSELLRRVGLDR
jgi:tetratricopeptide (TPR) repeat protein